VSPLEHVAQPLQLDDLALDLAELGGGDRLYLGALPIPVAVEREELAALLDGKAEAARALKETQAVHVVH
jgi:hypothetical protein